MHIVHLISSLKIGGAEAMLVDLVAALALEGHTQQVMCFHDGPNRQLIEKRGIKVYVIHGALFRYDFLFMWRLYRLLRSLKPSILHCSLWAANLFGRIMGAWLGIPAVCAVHLGVDKDGALRNAIDTYSFKMSKGVIAVSEDVAATIAQSGWRAASRIRVIRNGIDVARIQESAQLHAVTRIEWGLQEDDFVIGAVGRLIERKNFAFLMRVVAQLAYAHPRVRLMIVGSGPEQEALQSLANRLGIEKRCV